MISAICARLLAFMAISSKIVIFLSFDAVTIRPCVVGQGDRGIKSKRVGL